MSLAVTTEEAMVAHLQELQIKLGMDVVVHSRLMSFGKIPCGAEAVYRALRAVVGPEATVAVPTYTLRPPSGEWFDPKAERWERLGVLSDYIRQLPEAVRSACTMHSHAAIGPKAGLFRNISGAMSFGPGSDFDLLEELDFVAIYLGCGFPEAATFTFHVEACCGNIPYRHWLELERNARDPNDSARMRKIQYYARRSPEDVEDLDIVCRYLEDLDLLRSAQCPYGISYSVRLKEFKSAVAALFHENPSAILAQAG